MPIEDQERLEDYLELERYIEELRAGHAPLPPSELTPDDARIYRMVMLFRATSLEGDEPRPEFCIALQTRLEQERMAACRPQIPLPLSRRSFYQHPFTQHTEGDGVACKLADSESNQETLLSPVIFWYTSTEEG